MSFVEANEGDTELGQHLELAQKAYRLSLSDELISNKDELTAQLMEAIQANNMVSFYKKLVEQHSWDLNEELVASMTAANTAALEAADAKIKDATENFGELEIFDATVAKVELVTKAGDKAASYAALVELEQKSISTGQRIDALLYMLRTALFHDDSAKFTETLARAQKLVESGGDWDRRNRLKVYEATFAIMNRDFEMASRNLLASVSTFTSYELYSYNSFVGYTVIVAMIALDRVQLKKQVIDSSEVLSVIRQVPQLQTFLQALYNCDYSGFFQALIPVFEFMQRDRYLASHARFYLREMRVAGYKQFLASYLSVTTESMAQVFGVSEQFLDLELSRFIAGGRLAAKLDKTRGVVETNRPASRDAKYQAMIKQGDALLNRIQKLSQTVINA